MTEEWRDIPQYEGLYQVSNIGRVRSLNRTCKQSGITRDFCDTYVKKGRVLKLNKRQAYSTKTATPYVRKTVSLYKNGVRRCHKVHRLVAEAFIPNPENKPFVNHIDCNPCNNIVDNLEWSTPKENVEHMDQLGRRVTRVVKVKSVDCETGEEKIYSSLEDAVKDTGLQKGHICGCCRGYRGRKTCGGKRWLYV